MKAVKSNTFLAWKTVHRYMRELTHLGCPVDVAIRLLNLAALGKTVRLLPAEAKDALSILEHSMAPSDAAEKRMLFSRLFAGMRERGDGMAWRFREVALLRYASVLKWQSLPKETRRHARLWLLWGDYNALKSLQRCVKK